MDHLQYDLIANNRHADLLTEAAAQQQAHLAQPNLAWRERIAKHLVTVALRIAPRDSPLRGQTGSFSVVLPS